jgi:hypothetical protein
MKASPDIVVSSNGTVNVVYAIPLNDGRGIYMVSSDDQGVSWTRPTLVFDAAKAGWDKVDLPAQAILPDGSLHVVWNREPLPGIDSPNTLYYSQSRDSGATWSEAVAVSENSGEWNSITITDSGSLHRLWMSENGLETSIQHDYSVDGGTTWNPDQNLAKFGEKPVAAAVSLDKGGELHLVNISNLVSGAQILHPMTWTGSAWSEGEGLELDGSENNLVSEVAAAISPSDELSVLYTGVQNTESGEVESNQLYFSQIALDLIASDATPGVTGATPEPQTTQKPVDTVIVEQTPTPLSATPTPTVDLGPISQTGGGNGNSPLSNPNAGLILGGGLSAIIVAAIFLLGVRFIRQRQ